MSNLYEYFSDTSSFFWLSLFPVTYVIHITEEYFCGEGYSTYLFNNYGVELSPQRFVGLQTVGFLLMSIGTIAAASLKFPHTLLVIFSALVLTNVGAHALRSIMGRRYEPGLISATVLWAPLGSFTLLMLANSMTIPRYFLAVATGISIAAVVEIIARRGGKLSRRFS